MTQPAARVRLTSRGADRLQTRHSGTRSDDSATTTQGAIRMSDPRSAVRTTTCPDCEGEQLFGVEMTRDGDVWRCPRGHRKRVFARAFARAGVDPFAERDERREIREALREDTSRRGRCVPETATGGGDAAGESKDLSAPRTATVSRGIRLELGPLRCAVCDDMLLGGRRRYCSPECERAGDAARKRRTRSA